jgi:glycosyltransferase involved in cell wall biosynthesis
LARAPVILFVAMPGSIHTARWINQLEGRGWDVHLFPSLDWGRTHPELRAAQVHHSIHGRRLPGVRVRQSGINVYSHKIAWGLRLLLQLRFPRYRAWQLSRLIARLRPDVVHSMEFQAGGYLTLEAKDLLGGTFPTWMVSNWGSDLSLFGRLPEHRERIGRILAECDYYGCECERDVPLARAHGLRGAALPVLPNGGGFDLEAARKLRSPEPPSRRRILMVKGYQTWAGRALVALRALARCADLVRGYQVVVHSATEDVRLAAKLLAADHGIEVTLLAPDLPHAEMLGYHGRARLSLGLSIGDGISTSMLEAMLMGAFPIQSDTACGSEWLVDGQTGLIVPAEEPEAVERALRKALLDDGLVDRALEANWAVARERLDQAAIRPRVLESYERVLREGRRR